MGISRSKESSHTIDYKQKPQFTELGSSSASGGIEISKTIVDFSLGESPCPLKTPVHDQFELSNTNNTKMKFNFEPSFPKEFQLSFSPSAGTIDRHKSKMIKVKIIVHTKININHKVTLKIDGGASHFLTVRIRCETGVFGVDPASLEVGEDEENGYRVPSILILMKKSLVDNGGLLQEGIFRLAGEQTEIRRIKEIMNKKEFVASNDINTVASLIKIWFRELPTPILNALPTESIFYSSDMNECVTAFGTLPEPQKTLLDWLLHLLIVVSANSEVNKMTAQNLAIVVAPNLYDVSTSNPMEGLVMSQKCVQFLHNVLLWKIQHRN